jgi:hypothetical protein
MLFHRLDADAHLNRDGLVRRTFVNQPDHTQLLAGQQGQIRATIRQQRRQCSPLLGCSSQQTKALGNRCQQFAAIKRLIQHRDRPHPHCRHCQTGPWITGNQDKAKHRLSLGQSSLQFQPLHVRHDLVADYHTRRQFGRVLQKLRRGLVTARLIAGHVQRQSQKLKHRSVIVNDIHVSLIGR